MGHSAVRLEPRGIAHQFQRAALPDCAEFPVTSSDRFKKSPTNLALPQLRSDAPRRSCHFTFGKSFLLATSVFRHLPSG
ncbi:unnamed protein product, partial [Nesidiocoris tenuis]